MPLSVSLIYCWRVRLGRLFPHFEFPSADLPDLIRKSLDEETVVYHRQHGALKGRQGLLEPRPRRHIQMVDRLVQQ